MARSANPRPVTGGMYVPVITPFDDNEEIDFQKFEAHVRKVADAGCGIVVMGTNGEAIHLSDSERKALVESARKAAGDKPLIAGTGTGSMKETIRHSKEAAAAGADMVIVITPGYFGGAIAKDRQALKDFFHGVADASPVPVMIYNFPACASGIDLDSDLLIDIASHPNVMGAKLTCSMIGKGARLVEAMSAKRPGFIVFGGFCDILLPAMMSGMHGCIAGTANFAPRTCVRLYETIKAAQDSRSWDKLEEAQKLQGVVSRGDWAGAKGGIHGMKAFLNLGPARRPLPRASKEQVAKLAEELKEIMDMEKSLGGA